MIQLNIFRVNRSPDNYPPIKNRQLIFTPNNDIFKKLMHNVSKQLSINESIGVANVQQLEDTIVKDELIAGIVFHHSNVRLHTICFQFLLKFLLQKKYCTLFSIYEKF